MMTHENDEKHDRLLADIMPILFERGLRASTMDYVARRLGISKRTLYEIFESKEDMLRRVLTRFRTTHTEILNRIFLSSKDNMMKALKDVLAYHQEQMEHINTAFFSDMDVRYHELRQRLDKTDSWDCALLKVLKRGVEQGVFRPEINYPVMLTMLRLQMESLKRMEEYFPPDVTLGDAYKTISSSFLHSIASRKGLDILEAEH